MLWKYLWTKISEIINIYSSCENYMPYINWVKTISNITVSEFSLLNERVYLLYYFTCKRIIKKAFCQIQMFQVENVYEW